MPLRGRRRRIRDHGLDFYLDWDASMSKPIEACHISVGVRIRMIRETLGMSQADLAKRVGLQRVSVTNTEIGRQRLLLDSIERYATALGTTPKHLLKGIWW